MSQDGELIALADRARWDAALQGIDHAFGHTWSSCHAMHATTGRDTYLYSFRSGDTRFVCPIAERTFRGETDVTTPYGFSGFAGQGDAGALLQAWGRFARARGYVAGYIALNPLLTGASLAGAEEVSDGPELFFLDLSRSEEELLAAMKRGRRRPIASWEREGRPLESGQNRLVDFFILHFARFMESRGANAAYRMTQKTLRRLANSPGAFLRGAPAAGPLEAVALFCESPAIGEAVFSISTGTGNRHADVLMWAGAREFKRRGVRWLSLGGGISPGDGVAAVKRGYGAKVLNMPVLRQVYDRARFERLCRCAGVDRNAPGAYFPPWHAGVAGVR